MNGGNSYPTQNSYFAPQPSHPSCALWASVLVKGTTFLPVGQDPNLEVTLDACLSLVPYFN